MFPDQSFQYMFPTKVVNIMYMQTEVFEIVCPQIKVIKPPYVCRPKFSRQCDSVSKF